MKQNIIHIGLDVDDTQYHGAAFNKATGEVIDFKSRPTLKGLLLQVDRMARHFGQCTIKLCYEASYIGYRLQCDKVRACKAREAARKLTTLPVSRSVTDLLQGYQERLCIDDNYRDW